MDCIVHNLFTNSAQLLVQCSTNTDNSSDFGSLCVCLHERALVLQLAPIGPHYPIGNHSVLRVCVHLIYGMLSSIRLILLTHFDLSIRTILSAWSVIILPMIYFVAISESELPRLWSVEISLCNVTILD